MLAAHCLRERTRQSIVEYDTAAQLPLAVERVSEIPPQRFLPVRLFEWARNILLDAAIDTLFALVTTMLAACMPAAQAQGSLSKAEMTHRLGLSQGTSIDFHPVGRPTQWTTQYARDIRTPAAIRIARSAHSNLSEVMISLFGQRRPPELRLHTKLDPRFAAVSGRAVAAFNDREDVHAGRPPRKLPQNIVLTFLVSRADFGTAIDTYPYADEDMERDCHGCLCMVLAVDLDDPAHLDIALAQLARIEAEWARRDWTSALLRPNQGYFDSHAMSAYQSHLASGMEVLPASNPRTYSAVLGLVVRPAGRGVLGSYVAVGFIGEGARLPESVKRGRA